ncbi:unnamed protein product [Orchesella dallaii]|uniref:Uncharacterized protein n=1 Tax=Orchesella dallaii TaxID=48710 RepID=A0ABP1RZW9_9HEXA
MEKRLTKAGYTYLQDNTTKMAKIACSLLTRPIVISATFWGVGSALMPCEQINLFFNLMPKSYCRISERPSNWWTKAINYAPKPGIAILNGLTFYAAAGSDICCVVQIVAAVMCVRFNITVFGMLSKDFGKASKTLVRFHREIQILTGSFNFIHRTLLFHIMEANSLAQILLAFITLRCATSNGSDSPIPLFPLLVCGILAIQSVVAVQAIYGLGSEPHTCSSKILRNIKNIYGIAGSKYGRYFIASCPVLRVQIGTMNFIEKDTPLNMEAFCTERIIDLLLLH